MHPGMRPLGVGETLDAAIAICRRSYRRLLKISALVVLPVHVLSTLVLMSVDFSAELDTATAEAAGTELTGFVSALVVVAFLTITATTVAMAGSTKLVADTYLAEPGTAGASLRFAGRRFPALLGAALLFALCAGAGGYLCGIGGIWLAVAWSLFVPIIVVEGTGAVDALKRSFALTRHRWFATAGLLGITWMLQAALTWMFLVVGLIAFGSVSAGGEIWVFSAVQGVATALTLPLTISAVVVCYFDLRVRSEGFDVWMMIRGLDRAAVPAP